MNDVFLKKRHVMGALTSKFRQATYNIIKDQKTKE